ncbi:AarF/ABC1/UbiB kinase family protein [Desulfuromonas acetoxidans]|uniref:ABC1 kinase family protein n=1 Tax=Desulfuromonas acetoxidans TaxID=891 RepID=UPI0029318D72|nr:AarF/ABC1/UbiB kinase family protein [Desulfuromonas acetoxidans]
MLPLLHLNRNLRSLNRYREVLAVLVSHGFGHVLDELNLDYYIELGRRLVKRDNRKRELEKLPPQVRLRMALEELGPTFIKLGQILSARPDILPASYITELNKLQNDVRPVELSAIKSQLYQELGAPVNELFSEFSPQPVAAASIAQVHQAKLPDGTTVAVKVRRPDIERIIETDLDILDSLSSLLENHTEPEELFSPREVIREFRRTIYRELDFTKEGHTLGRFRDNFYDSPNVTVPHVHWELTTDAILTMEYIDGIKISNTDQLSAAGHDLKQLAHNGAKAFLDQVLVFGLFHADPHPGNIFVLPDSTLCFIDLGMVGHVDDDLRQQLTSLLLGIFKRDTDLLVSVMLAERDRSKEINTTRLKRELSEFIDDYYKVPLEHIDFFKLITEFIDLMRRHHIKFPSDLMLFSKAMVTIEGIGRQLDPGFNLIEEIKPTAMELMQHRLSAGNIGKETTQIFRSYFDVLKSLPQELKELLLRFNSNNFKIDLEHRGLEKLITDLDKASNRLSFSFIIGSLIIGSSLIIQTNSGPQLFGLPALGLLGYAFAAALGLWLALGILRSGRL